MASIGAAAASGLESGFRMAQDFQDREDRKARDEREFGLRERTLELSESRQAKADARQTKLDERQDVEYAGRVAGDLSKSTTDEFSATVSQYGSWETTPPAIQAKLTKKADAAGQAVEAARKRSTELAFGVQQQKAKDIITNLQAGRVQLKDLPDEDYALAIADALGDPRQYMKGKNGEPSAVEAAVADVTNGMSTQNHGMWVRGANVLLSDELQRPVGTESAHGGKIVGQELLDFIPHPTNPDLVSPVVRVYVDQGKQFVGPRGKSESTAYYDAPITEDRSTRPDAKVKWLNMQELMDRAGKKGVAAESLNQPEARAKLEAGLASGNARIQDHLDTYRALSAPKKEYTEKVTNMPADSGFTLIDKFDSRGVKVGREKIDHNAKPVTGGALGTRLAAIDEMEAKGELSAARADEARMAAFNIRPRVGRGEGGAGGAGGKISESTSKGIIDDATDAFKAKLGIKYDENLKKDVMWNAEGTRRVPLTPAMERRMDDGIAAIKATVRDATAKNKKVGFTEAYDAGQKTTATEPKKPTAPRGNVVKWNELK